MLNNIHLNRLLLTGSYERVVVVSVEKNSLLHLVQELGLALALGVEAVPLNILNVLPRHVLRVPVAVALRVVIDVVLNVCVRFQSRIRSQSSSRAHG